MEPFFIELANECKRLSESCSYTCDSLYTWLRFVRIIKAFFVVAPIVLGAIASSSILAAGLPPIALAVSAMLAGLFPAIFEALRLNVHSEDVKSVAIEFNNLRDRFRQCANIYSIQQSDQFLSEFEVLRDRLEQVRSEGVTVPVWCYWLARKKGRQGQLSYDVDKALPSA